MATAYRLRNLNTLVKIFKLLKQHLASLDTNKEKSDALFFIKDYRD